MLRVEVDSLAKVKIGPAGVQRFRARLPGSSTQTDKGCGPDDVIRSDQIGLLSTPAHAYTLKVTKVYEKSCICFKMFRNNINYVK